MKLAVYKFNQQRNNFDFDIELEAKMLTEEVVEFFDADDLADRMDAYVDVEYVWQGMQMKMMKASQAMPEPIHKWITDFKAMAISIMREELGGYSDKEFYGYIAKAKDIVSRANAAKGNKLAGGKVSKENFGIDATQLIRDMLKE